MQGFFTFIIDTAGNLCADLCAAVRRHLGNHVGGSSSGAYVRLPLTRLSAWIEWRDKSMGWGTQRASARDVELFAGRLAIVASVESR